MIGWTNLDNNFEPGPRRALSGTQLVSSYFTGSRAGEDAFWLNKLLGRGAVRGMGRRWDGNFHAVHRRFRRDSQIQLQAGVVTPMSSVPSVSLGYVLCVYSLHVHLAPSHHITKVYDPASNLLMIGFIERHCRRPGNV